MVNAQFALTAPQLPLAASTVDPRHVQIREFIRALQRETGTPEQWNGRCARALSTWLKANPVVTIQDAERFVRNRFESDEPRGAPPWEWLPKLTKYSEGPLDRFARVWRPDWRVGCEGIRH